VIAIGVRPHFLALLDVHPCIAGSIVYIRSEIVLQKQPQPSECQTPAGCVFRRVLLREEVESQD